MNDFLSIPHVTYGWDNTKFKEWRGGFEPPYYHLVN